MTCNTTRVAPARCVCGGQTGVDDWFNHRVGKMEMFVRCISCGVPGPSADTGEEAIALWNAQHSTPLV